MIWNVLVFQWTSAHYWQQLKNSVKLHQCVKTKLICLRGTRKAIFFSASLWVDCNLAFPLNKMSSGISTLYIEKFVLNSTLWLITLCFHPFVSHVVKFIFWTGKSLLVLNNFVYVFSNLSLKDSKAAAVVPCCTSFQNDLELTLWTWIATVFFWSTSAKLDSYCHHLDFFQEPWRINGLCTAENICSCTEEINTKSKFSNKQIFPESLLIQKGCFGI